MIDRYGHKGIKYFTFWNNPGFTFIYKINIWMLCVLIFKRSKFQLTSCGCLLNNHISEICCMEFDWSDFCDDFVLFLLILFYILKFNMKLMTIPRSRMLKKLNSLCHCVSLTRDLSKTGGISKITDLSFDFIDSITLFTDNDKRTREFSSKDLYTCTQYIYRSVCYIHFEVLVIADLSLKITAGRNALFDFAFIT